MSDDDEVLTIYTYYGEINCAVSENESKIVVFNHLLHVELSFLIAEKVTRISSTPNHIIFLVPYVKKLYILRVDLALIYVISLEDMSDVRASQSDISVRIVDLPRTTCANVPELAHLEKFENTQFKLPANRLRVNEIPAYAICATHSCCFLAENTSTGAHICRILLEPNVEDICTNLLQFDGGAVKDMQAGNDHVILLTCDGEIYSFGTGSRGELGHGSLESDQHPKKILCMDFVKISEIACGSWHSAALTDDGDVYLWGWNNAGQLGTSNELGSIVETPLPVELDDPVVSVNAFRNATFLSLKDQTVITLGKSEYYCV